MTLKLTGDGVDQAVLTRMEEEVCKLADVPCDKVTCTAEDPDEAAKTQKVNCVIETSTYEEAKAVLTKVEGTDDVAGKISDAAGEGYTVSDLEITAAAVDPPKDEDAGMEAGVIVGIVIGALVGVVIIGLVVYYLMNRQDDGDGTTKEPLQKGNQDIQLMGSAKI